MDDDPMNNFERFNGCAWPTVQNRASNLRQSPSSGNNSPFFTSLDRKSAQFWVDDSQGVLLRVCLLTVVA